jgi:hypothetical protein
MHEAAHAALNPTTLHEGESTHALHIDTSGSVAYIPCRYYGTGTYM